jgi:hypothetical protein
MIKIPHTLNLVTEIDETHEVAQRLLALGDKAPVFLADLFAMILKEEKVLEKLNEGNSWARVEIVK